MDLFQNRYRTHRHRKQTYVTKGEGGRDKLEVWD